VFAKLDIRYRGLIRNRVERARRDY
jgi:hypothetical protein